MLRNRRIYNLNIQFVDLWNQHIPFEPLLTKKRSFCNQVNQKFPIHDNNIQGKILDSFILGVYKNFGYFVSIQLQGIIISLGIITYFREPFRNLLLMI